LVSCRISLTDPNNADTDGDTKNDGDEVKTYHTSPLVGQPNAADITILLTVDVPIT
jgi:hypothetical protein